MLLPFYQSVHFLGISTSDQVNVCAMQTLYLWKVFNGKQLWHILALLKVILMTEAEGITVHN